MGIGQGPASERMPPREAGLVERSIDDQADIIHNLLLNINDDCQRVIIIKLVSDSEIQRSIEEVLHSVPIEQATYNKSLVNWKDCTRPYAVDLRAFWDHTHGRSKGRPRHPDPKVCTNSEHTAISCAKIKVMETYNKCGYI